jgi:translation initiation factor IF-2
VRETFKVPKFGTIAGCMVTEGRMARTGDIQARLLRDHVVVHEGKVGSLRRFKDDVSEVKAGAECGISLERFNDIKLGDVIELFTVEKLVAVPTA